MPRRPEQVREAKAVNRLLAPKRQSWQAQYRRELPRRKEIRRQLEAGETPVPRPSEAGDARADKELISKVKKSIAREKRMKKAEAERKPGDNYVRWDPNGLRSFFKRNGGQAATERRTDRLIKVNPPPPLSAPKEERDAWCAEYEAVTTRERCMNNAGNAHANTIV